MFSENFTTAKTYLFTKTLFDTSFFLDNIFYINCEQ